MYVSILFQYSMGLLLKNEQNLDYKAISQKRLTAQK